MLEGRNFLGHQKICLQIVTWLLLGWLHFVVKMNALHNPNLEAASSWDLGWIFSCMQSIFVLL